MRTIVFTTNLLSSALSIGISCGEVVAQFDVGSSGNNSTDQTGSLQTDWADVNLSNSATGVTQNGITLTIGAGANESRNRTGPVIAGDPLENVFRDFLFTRDTDGPVSVVFSGLVPNAPYEITAYAYDSSGGNNETGYWYLGSVEPANLQHTWTSSIATLDDPGDIFLLTGTSDGSGTLSYVVMTDNTSRINGFSVAVAGNEFSSLRLTITPNSATSGHYDFSWDSQAGKVYDLLSSTDLSTSVETWSVYMSSADIPASGTATTTLLDVPGDGAKRFFAVLEKDAPPLMEEDFEAVTAPGPPTGWSFEDNASGTAWTVGTPAGAVTEPDAAANGNQCAGTNLGANYTSSAVASIITKAFTVPVGGATLTFSQYIDTELATSGDFGSVRLLNANDNSVLAGGDVATALEGITELWTSESIALPAAANGLSVKLEFRFESDEDSSVFSGFYIDDVVVTQN